MKPTLNLEKIPEVVQDDVRAFMNDLLAIHGEEIVSIVIYGSAAGGQYVPRRSDVNSAVIFGDIDFSVLKKSLSVISSAGRKKIRAPLFLTQEYILSSLDVFPIEFLDMQQQHVLIYGEDVLSSLDVPRQYVRLFCEQEIKGKLIRIRQAYLEVGLKPKAVDALLKDSLNSLIPIFRNLLRLRNKSVTFDKTAVLEHACGEFQLNSKIFTAIYRHVAGGEKIPGAEMDLRFGEYLAELKKLSRGIEKI